MRRDLKPKNIMIDAEDPTPRVSRPWELNADMARAFSQRVRERELVLSTVSSLLDTRRAAMLRHARMIADHYAAAFDRWLTDSVPIEQRAREQKEWATLVPFIVAVAAEDA